jgi:hypothetical protein
MEKDNLMEIKGGITVPEEMLTPHLIAGVLAGMAGLLVFLIIHHYWISPIWFILPFGLFVAGLGGLAVGWAYHELSPNLLVPPWNGLAFVALIGVILAPAILLAEIRQPLFTIAEGEAELAVPVWYAVVVFILELLVTAALVGGVAGWLIGRTPRAALATALAGFILALGPGHNIPFLGSTPGTLKGILILLAIILSATLVLVEASSLMSGYIMNRSIYNE